jgi:hypothetical protein
VNDPIAVFWTVIAAAVTYTIIGSTIISIIWLIANGNVY